MLISYEYMPKVSADIPQELLDDVQEHVGEDGKFVSTSDAIRSSLRKMLDQMDEIDRKHGRIEGEDG
jgi:Arc/MetJ-type ribon-helix-helix transcriptional regulator